MENFKKRKTFKAKLMSDKYTSILKWLETNPEEVINDLKQCIDQVETITTGLNKIKDSVLNNSSDKNTRKQLYTAIKSIIALANIVRKGTLINIVYMSKKINKDDYSPNCPPGFESLFGNFK